MPREGFNPGLDEDRGQFPHPPEPGQFDAPGTRWPRVKVENGLNCLEIVESKPALIVQMNDPNFANMEVGIFSSRGGSI